MVTNVAEQALVGVRDVALYDLGGHLVIELLVAHSWKAPKKKVNYAGNSGNERTVHTREREAFHSQRQEARGGVAPHVGQWPGPELAGHGTTHRIPNRDGARRPMSGLGEAAPS